MTFIIFFLIQGYNVRVHNNFFEVFSINFQAIPYLCDIVKSSNKLILVVRVTITLPAYEVRASSVKIVGGT